MGLRGQFRAVSVVAAAIFMSLVGCGKQFERPPVEVLQRESLLGAGNIVQIKSTTKEELTDIEVTIKTEDREVRHTELRLGAYQTIEIGWKKLDGWQIPDAAEIEVRVAGYALPVRARLAPAVKPDSGG
jgi:hypothetical protein